MQYSCERKLKVGLVCSSGIACKVYAKGISSTVHAYDGLGIADLPSKQVTQRAARNSLVVERTQYVDVIIWDEASMSSARILELVNCLHHELTKTECGEFYPFGGKQIVLVKMLANFFNFDLFQESLMMVCSCSCQMCTSSQFLIEFS
jgi:hypothetical protein